MGESPVGSPQKARAALVCSTCESAIDYGAQRTGRPRLYCSDACRRIAWHLSHLETGLENLMARKKREGAGMPASARASLRTQLQILVNTIPPANIDRRNKAGRYEEAP